MSATLQPPSTICCQDRQANRDRLPTLVDKAANDEQTAADGYYQSQIPG